MLAPTGSGKTLASFLWAIDRLMTEPVPADPLRRTRLVYVSPLRALAVDIEKNLRSPLAGISLAGARLAAGASSALHLPTVAVRTGDTPPDERRRLQRNPADILITTPESLYLMLTSSARETLRGVQAVIVDEIHVLAGSKRGAHLALSLERLAAVASSPPQRIGLSATQRPLEEVARFLGGHSDDGRVRPVRTVDAGVRKPLEIDVLVPVEDLADLGAASVPTSAPAGDDGSAGVASGDPGPNRRSIWPSLHPRLLDIIEANTSTLVFVNARRLAERLATRLNELASGAGGAGSESVGQPPAAAELVRAHHGSISREQRLLIEDDLKAGRLRGLVATSSLELGIDMGAVDRVVQVGSPGAVSRGLQRIGRAGHQVGAPSRGTIMPSHRADLLETAAVVPAMHAGRVEATRVPSNPLDVLAQQVVAMVALDDWAIDDLARLVRRAAPFHDLSDDLLRAVLDMLDGRYPSERFADLRPRLVWDRAAGTVCARPGAQRVAVINGGTIPDRGLYGVFLPDGKRVGELDEEMVYESRPGETFLLGASTWRIDDITHDRVIVTPAPGRAGTFPFWHGDGPGRPAELGRLIAATVSKLRHLPEPEAAGWLQREAGFDSLAAANLLGYLRDQAEATGAVPDERTIVVERFRDEIGDWRVCVLSPFGSRVHAPWGMAIRHVLAEHHDLDADVLWGDDGIAIRLPEAVDRVPIEAIALDPTTVRAAVIEALPGTALFAARFREASARALLLPRRRPGQRTPLWQQRRRAADLLAVASEHPTFPMLLEATRECINDEFDLPGLEALLRDVQSRSIRIVEVDTPRASPWAQSLAFDWIAAHMYDGDAPLGERRIAALSLDPELLAELLGTSDLRELLDPAVLAQLEAELQRLAGPRHPATDADQVVDMLRALGPLAVHEVAARCDVSEGVLQGWVRRLIEQRRVIDVMIAGEQRLAAADDAGRLRDGLGVAIPLGLPSEFTDVCPDGLSALVERYARTHGPFTSAEVATRLGVAVSAVEPLLVELERRSLIVVGEMRPGGSGREWCDAEVLRRLRQRTLAALRNEVEPVDAAALARFLPGWQGVGSSRRGVDGLTEAMVGLQGLAVPASVLESDVLPARVHGYQPSDLDQLCAAGEVVWVGAGALGARDGRIRLCFRDQAPQLLAAFDPSGRFSAGSGFAGAVPGDASGQAGESSDLHSALRGCLATRGASFWSDLVEAAAAANLPYDDESVLGALWDLVWAGEVTNDTFAPLRAFLEMPASRRASGGAGRRRHVGRPTRLQRLGPAAGRGRWSAVGSTVGSLPSHTEAIHTLTWQLLERHGVLTREAVIAEGVPGGYAAVYPVLKALEERGSIRRGYFVAGLGAAQFALPGAVDRIRAHREPVTEGSRTAPDVIVLAATDPAQPYGAALAWPLTRAGRPARTAGARLILVGGRPLVFVERSSHRLLTFESCSEADDASLVRALVTLAPSGRGRALELTTIDGQPARAHRLAPLLRDAGFVDGYRGLILRQHPAGDLVGAS